MFQFKTNHLTLYDIFHAHTYINKYIYKAHHNLKNIKKAKYIFTIFYYYCLFLRYTNKKLF